MEYDQFKEAEGKGKINLLEPGIGLEMIFLCFNENTNVDAKTGQPLVDPKKLKVVSQREISPGQLLCDRPRRHHQNGLFRSRRSGVWL